MIDDPNFSGPSSNHPSINLSTSSSTSSSALLSSVRAQRLAREQIRRNERAALVLQRYWRGYAGRRRFKSEGLSRIEGMEGVAERARGLVGVLGGRRCMMGVGYEDRVKKVVGRWCEDAMVVVDARPQFLDVLEEGEGRGYPPYLILGILSCHILQLVVSSPTTVQSGKLFAFLEQLFNRQSYAMLSAEKQGEVQNGIVEVISGRSWVEMLVQGLETLVAASLPKKKHPHLQYIARLLTAPLTLCPPTQSSPLIIPLINHLLAVPALPQTLPLPSLTHLSSTLPLFTLLLPAAASDPSILFSGRLGTELGRTYFLGNLATFGITGGMLARHGQAGSVLWIKVVSNILSRADEGWGKWAEGSLVEDIDVDVHMKAGSEDDDEPMPLDPGSGSISQSPTRYGTQGKRQRRLPLAKNITSKLVLLASPSHLATLTDSLVSASAKSSTNTLMEYASFALSLLQAWKGTSRWESILDGLLVTGPKGRGLVKRIWREGVRGRWGSSGEKKGWETFSGNASAPCLLLLTHMYCHYLLLTPDDEFFAENSTNPLSLDEVLELSGIWRDLAFWGYMLGVSADSNPVSGYGNEETRNLFTRGVTRVSERNARKKFAPSEYWVMSSQIDLRGFVEAAVFEDAELSLPQDEMEDGDPAQIPRWARARQRYTKRQMAHISPRLGLLNNLPMAVPFQTRLEVFQQFVDTDRYRLRIDRYDRRSATWNRATIRRDHLSEDGFRQLNNLGPALKGTIQISFIDAFGQEEAGIDGGGLFKEFLTGLTKEAFDTDRGLWLVTDQNELYPNPHSMATEPHSLSWYGFMGRVLGKAIYDGILVDVSFAGFFLSKWLGRQSYLDDLSSLDKELYKGLIILKNYPEPEELALNFTITEQEFGVARSVDLVPGGADIAVTAENRHEYIQLVCKYKLDRQIALQSRAFFNGMADVIDAKWLRMFDQHELSQLIGGEDSHIDLDDLRANTVVSGFPDDRTMRLFWKVVKRFNQEQRRALIKFVTSCARPPLLGFGHLNPKFGIRYVDGDTARLPSASSCFNLLKLPGYTDESLLKEKLLQAINSGAGFDLS